MAFYSVFSRQSHNRQEIGPVAGFTEEERCYRAQWGLADEIAGWCVCFHEFRV
jgi:hypothetical protein